MSETPSVSTHGHLPYCCDKKGCCSCTCDEAYRVKYATTDQLPTHCVQCGAEISNSLPLGYMCLRCDATAAGMGAQPFSADARKIGASRWSSNGPTDNLHEHIDVLKAQNEECVADLAAAYVRERAAELALAEMRAACIAESGWTYANGPPVDYWCRLCEHRGTTPAEIDHDDDCPMREALARGGVETPPIKNPASVVESERIVS